MTSIINKLEHAQLAERRYDVTDRRSLTIHPTTSGTQTADHIQQGLDTFITYRLSDLSEEEHGAYRKALTSLASPTQ